MDEREPTAFSAESIADHTVAAQSDGDGAESRTDAAVSPTSDDDDSGFEARDPEIERERICSFLERQVTRARSDGVVVNMSGGLDSTVTAALAVEAVGADNVYGLILPCNKIGAPHARDAEALADALGIEYDTIHLQPLFTQFGSVAPDQFNLHDEPTRTGNAVARLRMTLAYLAANAMNRLVCGTTNRSELLLGYFTKHGDGAADLLPLGHLYKTEVRTLATELSVPEFVVEKPPSAGFLPGQRDADDLGAAYETIDPVLQLGVDRGLDSDAISDRFDESNVGPAVDAETITGLLERHRSTAHKRVPPPIPGGIDR